MNFEKCKLEGHKDITPIVSLVAKVFTDYDGEGQIHESEEIICSFMFFHKAEKYASDLNIENKDINVNYIAYSVEIKI